MRERKKWAVTGILLAAALTLQVLARYMKGFADWYGTGIYPCMVFVVGGFFFCFSVQCGGAGSVSVSGMDCAVYGGGCHFGISSQTRYLEKLLCFPCADGIGAASDFYAVLRNQLSQCLLFGE